jgi:hypothetical protein
MFFAFTENLPKLAYNILEPQQPLEAGSSVSYVQILPLIFY